MLRIRVFYDLNGCIFLGYGKRAGDLKIQKQLRAIVFHLSRKKVTVKATWD